VGLVAFINLMFNKLGLRRPGPRLRFPWCSSTKGTAFWEVFLDLPRKICEVLPGYSRLMF